MSLIATALLLRKILGKKKILGAGSKGLIKTLLTATPEKQEDDRPDDLITGDPVRHHRMGHRK